MTESIREDVDIASIIKTEVNKLNCDKLRAQESKTKDVTSGYQTYIDLTRMSEVLIVNEVKIDPGLVKNLLGEVENNPDNKVLKSLVNNKLDHETIKILASEPEEKEGFSNLLYYCNKQYYHSILAEVFTKIFQHVGAKVPDEYLISELIVNLNQAGYQGTLYHNVFAPSAVKCNLIPHSSAQVIYINCNSSNEIKFKIDEKMDMSKSDYNNLAKEVLASLSSSVMFILQSDRNNNVSYTGGKLSDITLQVSEGFDLEKNENLFSKFIEWIKIFMENSFGIRLDKASVRITKLDKPNSKMEDATVQPCEQKLVPHAMGI